jgi:hypothetical protein
MNYTNKHDVRFKLLEEPVQGCYVVKYYSGVSKWPRILRRFYCTDDETRREMFYLLNNFRLCTLCKEYLVEESRSICRQCITLAASTVHDEEIDDCPVCYEKMFRINETKRKLACGHNLCIGCARRLMRSCHLNYTDPYIGPIPTCTITCPLCRNQGLYDYSLRTLENTAHVPPNGAASG